MLDRLTRKERAQLKQHGIQVNVVDNPRYKRKEIVFHVPGESPRTDWVLWKMAVVKGGKTKRLALGETHRGAFWKLVHRSRGGKGWHSQGERGSIADLVAYAVRHDFFYIGSIRSTESTYLASPDIL
jgi:hypothetical protein